MRTKILLATLLVSCAAQSGSGRLNPSIDRASTETAEALIRGDYAGALARVDRGLAAYPEDPWLLYNRGVSLAGLGRIDESLNTLRAAESRFTDPHERSLAAYRRALSLEFAGRCAEASTELGRYAALSIVTEPKLTEEALSHLQFCIAPTAQQLAEREQAARLRRNMGDEGWRRAEAASTAAVTALVRGDYRRALAAAEQGLAVAPADPWLMYNMGTALAGLERVDDALLVLQEAERRFSPQNIHGRSVAIYRRAIALEVAGRCEEAGAELLRYAALVTPARPELAQHALVHLKFCKTASSRKTF